MNLFVEGSFLFFPLTAWSTALINMTVKGLVLIATVLFFGFLFRKCSASVQSLLWTFLFVCLLAIPIIENSHFDILPLFDNIFQDKNYGADSLILLSEKAPNFQDSYAGTSGGQASATMQPSSQQSNTAPETINGSGWSSSHWLQLIVIIWSAGVIVFLIRLINGLLNGWLVARTAASPENKMITDSCERIKKQLGIRKLVKLRISGKTKIPFISWLGGPQIVMPLAAENWSRITLGAVLIHELAHVKRFDLFKLILANVVCAFHWFNPLVWIAARRLHIENEKACDDYVIKSAPKPAQYARQLLNFAVHNIDKKAVSTVGSYIINKSSLEERVLRIVHPLKSTRQSSKIATFFSIFVAALVTILTISLNVVSIKGEDSNIVLPNSAEEIFRWFPNDEYGAFGFKNAQLLSASHEYEAYKLLSGKTGYEFDVRSGLLKDYMVEELKTAAYAMKIYFDKDQRPAEYMKDTEKLWVFRFEEIDNLVSLALSNGDFIDSGRTLSGRPVFLVPHTSEKGKKRTWYGYADGDNHLLIARTSEQLRLMVRTGPGLEPGIMNNPHYAEMFDVFPGNSPAWIIEDDKIQSQASIDEMKKDGSTERQIRQAERAKRNSRLFNVWAIDIDNSLTYRNTRIYGNENYIHRMEQLLRRENGYSNDIPYWFDPAFERNEPRRIVSEITRNSGIDFQQLITKGSKREGLIITYSAELDENFLQEFSAYLQRNDVDLVN